ncbi:tyrosine-type recombinase/integrase [Flavobacterium granuli]|uniref:Integrase n=1 Tax=Flavobacterium granuli TaxID=280093 RepID=A0ABU1S4L2_9FLAO|nr:tyrosine-type recombinase/integrase [Flavobacterium granuli]MDR6845943.1 integrase [Flavobacterium granuli]
MKYTFKLKEPNSDKETLILFTCSFKEENKKFVYSTGETILPKHWDKESKFPFVSGSKKAKTAETIKQQLNRYSDLLIETDSLYKRIDETLTSTTLKKVFDEQFKKTVSGKNVFFDAFDEFMTEKKKAQVWAKATVLRYDNIKNILENFEKAKKYKLTYSRINKTFHNEFTAYCMGDLKHINNTYARNLTLFKSFMYWSVEKKYTFNTAFIGFKKVPKVITNQIALTIDDLNKLMQHKFKTESLERVRDVFVFACVTGMRFGELSLIKRSNVNDNYIVLKEDKDETKEAREIPLTSLSRYILLKYDYKLPLIANQKQNKYIKDCFQEMEYTHKVQKVTTKGKENIKEDIFFYDRISTHTARRTFITMMKRQGKSDKLIASITGHNDMKTLNQYYQVNDDEKKEAMDEVFNVEIPLKKIV